jgi:cobalt/nickel transport system permease protein
MHIPDGMLSATATVGGYAITGLATWYSLRKIKQKEDVQKEIPKASLITAAFFVTSWIHIPIPPTSVHLMLSGLLGILMGYFSFPAVIIALFFQAVMFQHGGLTTIGVNAVILGLPAMICFYLYNFLDTRIKGSKIKDGILGFFTGSLGLFLSVFIFFLVLMSFIPANIDVEAEKAAIYTGAFAHGPLLIIEGIFTSFVVLYLKKVKPEMLEDNR